VAGWPVTALLAVLAGVLVYSMHAGEPAPSRPPRLRSLFFALLGTVTVALLLGARAREPASNASMGVAFRAYTEGMLEAKRATVPVLLPPGQSPESVRAGAIRRYREAVMAMPESTRFRRELAILLAEQGQRQQALRELQRVVQELRRRGDPHAAVEAALWPRVYGDPPPRPAEVPALRARVEALHLGWFRYLVLAALYERAGLPKQAAAMRRAARDEAFRQQMLLIAVSIGLLMLVVTGLFLGILFVVQAVRRVWRPVGGRFRAPAFLLWEAFLLFMFLNAAQSLPRLFFPALPRFSTAGTTGTERTLALLLLWVLVGDLLAFAVLIYLAAALRRRGLTLAEIGLTARHVGSEILWGLGAYAAGAPWVFLVAWLSQWAGTRLFPDVAPPFHPVQALSAWAPAGWTRFGLFLLVAVSAPLVEETFFRGILYGALRRRFGVAAGIIGSSGIFAILHPQLPLGFLPIFTLGALLAGLYEWRRSLLPGMLFHGVNNGLLFLFLNILFPPAS
jgi:membrane protease YdiL (CAAX protease family)